MALPRVFIDLQESNGNTSGRIIFEFFINETPLTTKDFLHAYTSQTPSIDSKILIPGKVVSINHSGIHLDLNNLLTSDSMHHTSISHPEIGIVKHDQACLLSKLPNTNTFLITSQPNSLLDKEQIVFARLVDGQDFFRAIEKVKVDDRHRPLIDLDVIRIGELERVAVRAEVKEVINVHQARTSSLDDEIEQDSDTDKAVASKVESGIVETNPYIIGVMPPSDIEYDNRFLGTDRRRSSGYKINKRPSDAKDDQGRKIRGRGALVFHFLTQKYKSSSIIRTGEATNSNRDTLTSTRNNRHKSEAGTRNNSDQSEASTRNNSDKSEASTRNNSDKSDARELIQNSSSGIKVAEDLEKTQTQNEM